MGGKAWRRSNPAGDLPIPTMWRSYVQDTGEAMVILVSRKVPAQMSGRESGPDERNSRSEEAMGVIFSSLVLDFSCIFNETSLIIVIRVAAICN